MADEARLSTPGRVGLQLIPLRSHTHSVKDSGWIDTEQITALIGTNESGKKTSYFKSEEEQEDTEEE